MGIQKWDPFLEFDKLRTFFKEIVDRSFQEQLLGVDVAQRDWAPPVDVVEEPDRYLVCAEIPGVSEDETVIEFKNSQLHIHGRRILPFEKGEAVFQRLERQHGPFSKVITISRAIEEDQIKANYENGVLMVALPFKKYKELDKIPIERKS